MPSYLVNAPLWWSLLPIPMIVAALALAGYVILTASGGRMIARQLMLPLSAFLLLGMVSGYLTGLSRESAVGAVIPAVLSLLGGAAAIVLGRTANPLATTRVSALMLVFSLGLLFGSGWGANSRQEAEDYEDSAARLKQRALDELQVREYREALGLAPEIPTSHYSAARKKEK